LTDFSSCTIFCLESISIFNSWVDNFFISSSSNFLLYLDISSSINHLEKKIFIKKNAISQKIKKSLFIANIQIHIESESSQEIILKIFTINEN
jgi:hypothetical protein